MRTLHSIDETLLRDYAKELSGGALTEPSIVICDPAGSKIEWNADVPYYPACMIKLPVCVAAYILLQHHKIPNDEITVTDAQITESAHTSPFVAGYRSTIGELVHYALHYSDNTAANVLIDVVGRERGTAVMRELGLEHTAIRRWLVGWTMKADPFSTGRNIHSPADNARLLSLLLEGRIPNSDLILSGLEHSSPRDVDFFGMRPGDKLYFKDGYTNSVTHIGSIIYPRGSTCGYICVVYTNLQFSPDNQRKIGRFIGKLRSQLL